MTADELIEATCRQANLPSIAEEQMSESVLNEMKGFVIQSGVGID